MGGRIRLKTLAHWHIKSYTCEVECLDITVRPNCEIKGKPGGSLSTTHVLARLALDNAFYYYVVSIHQGAVSAG